MAAGFIIIVLTIIIVSAMFLSSIVGGRTNWTVSFQMLAQRYGGWFSPAGVFRRPAATFNYKEMTCHVRCRGRGASGPETELRIQWPIKNMRIEVLRNYGQPRIRAFRLKEVASVGDPAFEEQFGIYAQDPELARQLLSSGVRWQIQQLNNFRDQDSVYVGIHKGWLTIAKYSYIKKTQTLDDFVRFALDVFDQLMLTLSKGIEFKDDGVLSAVEVVQCPVCSNDVEGQMVICVRCKTPHCLDCWQYNGSCGMFACGETRFANIGSSSVGHQTQDPFN